MWSQGVSSGGPKPKCISKKCLEMRESKIGLTGMQDRFENSDEDGDMRNFLQRTSHGNN